MRSKFDSRYIKVVANFVSSIFRTLYIELCHLLYTIETIQFENSIKVQKYLRQFDYENYNFENEEDFFI